jgi:tetratricopeptide (TPR) repeat protein
MNRIRIFFIVLAIFAALPLITHGQEKTADRYRKLKSVDNDADDLLKEAETLKDDNTSEALDKVEEALGVSLAQGDVLNESKSYIMLGEINMKIGEWKLALDNFTSAHDKLKDKYQKTAQYKQSLRGLAITNSNLGNYQQAIQFYETLSATRLTSAERVQIDLGISDVYYQMGNYAEALEVIRDYSSPKSSSTATDRGLIQNQQAKIYAKMNEPDKARDAFISSQNTLRSAPSSVPQKNEAGLGYTPDPKEAKEEVAEVLHDQKRYDDEIALRNQSIEFNLESNNLPEVTKDKVGLSKALAAKGETSEAIRELEEAALMADTINNPKDQAKAFLALADIYEKNGRNNQALSAYKKYSKAVNKTEQQSEAKLIEKAELIKKQRDIEELRKDVAIGQREETIAMGTVFRQQLIIYGLIALILVIAVTSYFIYRNARASKIANQLLALKSLRSQMNPHFIFNALNSVNQFIAQNDERTANKFLTEFSRLMRLVMENSQEDFIPLHKEKEIISLYLKLEHYRFRDKFDYEINIDENINADVMEIPPMLLQPYIENAVWHGLRYKESKGHLALNMRKNSHGIEVEIADDGIGRKRSAALKTENQKKQVSTGLRNIEERLRIINKVYKANYRVAIEDLDAPAGTGTRVTIHVPEHKQNGSNESSNY